MAIKVIPLDIYGTVLATDDPDNELPPRKGLEEFFDKCDYRKIKVVSSSDSNLINLKIDLLESSVDISRFDKFYQLKMIPKNYMQILEDYKITAKELFVIGNALVDVEWPRLNGAGSILVPDYYDKRDDFRLDEIEF